MNYLNCSKQELEKEYSVLVNRFEELKSKQLNLNMARGKPGKAQLDISNGLLDVINSKSEFVGNDKMDCRNYGILDGIDEKEVLKLTYCESLYYHETKLLSCIHSH